MVKLMLHLKASLRVQFKGPLKMHKKVTKSSHSTLDLMVHLKVNLLMQLRMPLRGYLTQHPKVVP